MSRFKKIIIFILLISSPLFALLFGYPVSPSVRVGNLNYSKRCFKVGEFKQFINCFKNNPTLKGSQLISTLNDETAGLFSYFNILFFFALILQIALLFILI